MEHNYKSLLFTLFTVTFGCEKGVNGEGIC